MFHPSLIKHAYEIYPTKHSSKDPYSQPQMLFLQKRMAHTSSLSTLLIMRLSNFNEPFIILNSFINVMSNESNSSYIVPHVVFKMH